MTQWDASNYPPKQCSDCQVPRFNHLVTEKLTKSHSSANHCRGRWNQQKQQCIKLPGLTRSPPHTRHSACQSSTQVGGASANTNKNARVPLDADINCAVDCSTYYVIHQPGSPSPCPKLHLLNDQNRVTATWASTLQNEYQFHDSKRLR